MSHLLPHLLTTFWQSSVPLLFPWLYKIKRGSWGVLKVILAGSTFFLWVYVIPEASWGKFHYKVKRKRENSRRRATEVVLRFRNRSRSAEFLLATGYAYLALIPCLNPFRKCPPSSSSLLLSVVLRLYICPCPSTASFDIKCFGI